MRQYWDPACSAGEHDNLAYLREHFNPLSEHLTRGRYGRVSGYMAQHCPIAHTDQVPDGIWSVSSYRYLADIHRDNESFSNYPVLLQDFGNARPMIPMESDPPLHVQYKQALSARLSRKVQTEREPFYQRVTKQCIVGFLGDRRCDLFEQLCKPLAVQSLMEALGVPARDWDRLAELGFQQARGEGHDAGPQIFEYFSGLIEEKRDNPGEDLISQLCMATVDGRLLTDTEIADCSVILMPAGFETTASSLGFMFLLIAERPELQRRLREEPSLIPSAIEEMMRFITPTRSHTRTVRADTTIGNHQFKKGERIHLNWAGANHDPAVFDHPEQLLIERQPNRHMGFGFGAHTCVGIHMARAEMKVAVEEVLAAMDDIRVSAPGEIVEHPGSTWGVGNLPVRFVPR